MSITATSDALSKFTPPRVPAAGVAGAVAGAVAGGCAGGGAAGCAGGAGGCDHKNVDRVMSAIPTRSFEFRIIGSLLLFRFRGSRVFCLQPFPSGLLIL